MNPPIDIPQSEENIPKLAQIAVDLAFQDAMASGLTVLALESGALVEISADGSRREIKRLPPGLAVTPGETIALR